MAERSELYTHKSYFGTETPVAGMANVNIGDTLSFDYLGKSRYAYVLNPDYEGKCHALTLEVIPRSVLAGEVIALMDYDNLSPDPKHFYDTVVGRDNILKHDAYRTFIISKMSNLTHVEYIKHVVEWHRPDVSALTKIIELTATRFGLNVGVLMNQAENGALMTWPDRAWRKLQNSNSYQVPVGGINHILTTFGHTDVSDSLSELREAFDNGKPVAAPMVLFLTDRTDTTPYLMTGEIKMMYARARGTIPKVWLVSLSTTTT